MRSSSVEWEPVAGVWMMRSHDYRLHYQGNRFHGEEGCSLMMIFSISLFDQYHVLNTNTKLSIFIETRLCDQETKKLLRYHCYQPL